VKRRKKKYRGGRVTRNNILIFFEWPKNSVSSLTSVSTKVTIRNVNQIQSAKLIILGFVNVYNIYECSSTVVQQEFLYSTVVSRCNVTQQFIVTNPDMVSDIGTASYLTSSQLRFKKEHLHSKYNGMQHCNTVFQYKMQAMHFENNGISSRRANFLSTLNRLHFYNVIHTHLISLTIHIFVFCHLILFPWSKW